jgi:ABC-type sugar transport system ATPase subunit
MPEDDPAPVERARASLAGALERGPRALIVEGPARSPSYRDMAHVCRLVRAIADRGVAVLMTTDDIHGMAGADRAVSMSYGEMRGELRPPTPAPVVGIPTTEQ